MTSLFILFITITLCILISVNTYIFVRGYQSLPARVPLKVSYTAIFLFIAFSPLANMILARALNIELPNSIVWIGSLWLAMMLYLFIGIFLIDIIRFLNYFFKFLPSSLYRNYNTVKLITACSVFIISSTIVLFGYINAISPKLKKVEINIKSNTNSLEKLDIIFMSDIHLGALISYKQLSKIVNISNSVNPDIVILGGDIVDYNIKYLINKNLGDLINKFQSKYGVFAVLGNHEYISGYETLVEYFEEYNVKFLRDEFVIIEDSVILAGRNDVSIERFLNTNRKSISDIIPNNPLLPIILVDHQPVNLDEAVTAKISLQLSGHTHDGQMWPISYITDYVWEIPYGYKKIEDTQFFVSSGTATWGPPVRVGSRSEVVHVRVNFSGH